MFVGAQDLDQHIVVNSILGPSSTNLVSIETLVEDSTTPTKPPLIDPFGPEFFQLNHDGFTPAYTYLPFPVLYPMVESVTSLPSTPAVSSAMQSLPPLSVATPTLHPHTSLLLVAFH